MKFVLSIDGGGIRGIIPAVVLKYLEERLNRPLHECFDLITGTSTGGIIAAGLCIPDGDTGNPKFSAGNLLNFYVEDSHKIFGNPNNMFKRLFHPKYDGSDLYQTLHEKIGNVPFGEMMTRVMIPTYDISNRRPYFFKSWKYSVRDMSTDRIMCATASAPTFFPPTLMNFTHGMEPKYLIDGAVAANNPAMCALAEARRLWGNEDIFILSIGAGDVSDPRHSPDQKFWGVIPWLSDIVSIMTDAPVNTVDYQLHTMMPDMYVRLQHKIEYADDSIDNVKSKNLTLLIKEGETLIEREKQRIDRVATLINAHKKLDLDVE